MYSVFNFTKNYTHKPQSVNLDITLIFTLSGNNLDPYKILNYYNNAFSAVNTACNHTKIASDCIYTLLSTSYTTCFVGVLEN